MNRRAASAIVTIAVIMSVFSFTLMTFPGNVRASTLFVGGTGPGNYTTIAAYSFLKVVALIGWVLNLIGGFFALISSNYALFALTAIGEAFAIYAFFDSGRQIDVLEGG